MGAADTVEKIIIRLQQVPLIALLFFSLAWVLTIIFTDPTTFDSYTYWWIARALEEGKVPKAIFPPGYPAALLFAKLFLKSWLLAGLIVSLFSGISVIILTRRLEKKLFKSEGLGSLFLAVNFVFVMLAAKILSDVYFLVPLLLSFIMEGPMSFFFLFFAATIRPEALLFAVSLSILRKRAEYLIAFLSLPFFPQKRRLVYNLAIASIRRNVRSPFELPELPKNPDIPFFLQNLPGYVSNIARINLPYWLGYLFLATGGLIAFILLLPKKKLRTLTTICFHAVYSIFFWPEFRFLLWYLPFLLPAGVKGLRRFKAPVFLFLAFSIFILCGCVALNVPEPHIWEVAAKIPKGSCVLTNAPDLVFYKDLNVRLEGECEYLVLRGKKDVPSGWSVLLAGRTYIVAVRG